MLHVPLKYIQHSILHLSFIARKQFFMPKKWFFFLIKLFLCTNLMPSTWDLRSIHYNFKFYDKPILLSCWLCLAALLTLFSFLISQLLGPLQKSLCSWQFQWLELWQLFIWKLPHIVHSVFVCKWSPYTLNAGIVCVPPFA